MFGLTACVGPTGQYDLGVYQPPCFNGSRPDASGGRARGLVAHSALAVSPDGQPLGVLHVDVWAREDRDVPKRHSPRKRATAEKESGKWLKGVRAVARALPAAQLGARDRRPGWTCLISCCTSPQERTLVDPSMSSATCAAGLQMTARRRSR